MPAHDRIDVEFSLSAPAVPSVGVRLSNRGGRWLAKAECVGAQAAGIGASPRGALTAALTAFGQRTASALLADPALFAVSCAVAG